MKHKTLIRIVYILIIGLSVFLPAVKAAPGDFDVTFGQGGKLFDFFAFGGNDSIRDSAIQADGKIVAVGPAVFGAMNVCKVIRYNADGTLDPFFGATIRVGTSSLCTMVEIQADGKIVIAGSSFFVRLNPNGTFDTSFSGDGIYTPSNICAHSGMVIQPDGKYVLSGACGFFGNQDFGVARFNPNATFDTSFAGDGVAVTSVAGNDAANDVAVQADGKPVAVGGTSTEFAIVRYNVDGTLDNSFSGDGIVTTSILAGGSSASSAAIQADGKILAGGFASGSFAIARYNTDGTLDTSFDGDGIVTTAVGTGMSDLRIQPDGKIVASGFGSSSNIVIVRYNTDGSLDQTFDSDGIVTSGILGTGTQINAMLIQADGKIITAGAATVTDTNFAVARFNSTGALDTTFNGSGAVITNNSIRPSIARAVAIKPDGKIVVAGESTELFGSNNDFTFVQYNSSGGIDWKTAVWTSSGTDNAKAVAIQPDGKIVAAGESSGSQGLDFGVARLNSDGSIDNSFDGDGWTRTPVLSANDNAAAVAVQADGKIVVAGYSRNSTNEDDFALVRYNADGSLDTSFDGDGKLTTNVLTHDRAQALAIQPDGKILAAGVSGGNTDFTVIRYNTDGSLDTSFDGDGIAAPTGLTSGTAYSVKLQPDGKIVVGGTSGFGSSQDFAVVRYNADGSLDTTFSDDGRVTTSIASRDDANALSIQPNGKIVVAGAAENSTSFDFALARYNADGSPDTTFGGDGKVVYDMLNGSDDKIYGMALDSTGRAVVAGETEGVWTVARIIGDTTQRAPFDFDGDGRTDISIFRPSNGDWWCLRSSNGQSSLLRTSFGGSTSKISPADYTGDGKTDISFLRVSPATWFILRSEDNGTTLFPFGDGTDVPAPGDFDGDGKADAAAFRPADGDWHIRRSSDGVTTVQHFGLSGDVPVTGDYDGDGKSDIAIYRPSNGQWWIQRSSAGLIVFQFGNSTDKPVPGDYTGDGKTDVAVWRPSTGEWFVLRSEDYSYYAVPFGTSGDIPAPGDYDGDGRIDTAVFRPSNNTWYVNRSTSGFLITTFGTSGDRPVPSAFIP